MSCFILCQTPTRRLPQCKGYKDNPFQDTLKFSIDKALDNFDNSLSLLPAQKDLIPCFSLSLRFFLAPSNHRFSNGLIFSVLQWSE